MAVIRDYINYGTSTAVTITLASLPTTSARCSTVIVNDTSTGMYTDYMGIIALRTTTGTHASDMCCYAYLFGGTGTDYDSPGTNADGAVTVATSWNLKGPVVINFGTSVTGLISQTKVFMVSPIFGGEIPAQFGVILQNQTGITLDSTAGNLSVNFIPVYHTMT
jgi:hypothetical protein